MTVTTSTDAPAATASQIVSVRPVALTAPARGQDLLVRVTAPTVGTDLPVVVFSHGFAKSMDAYRPLADFWAEHGFVVVQPTHLDSAAAGVAADDPRTPDIWRTRIADLGQVIDELDPIVAGVPGLAGRVDPTRLAVAGHSWGATSASALVGARVVGADGLPGPGWSDPRVTAAVLLALTGTGGDDLSPFAAEHFAFMNPDFSELDVPSLLVAGDHDQSMLSSRGPDWFTDAFGLAPRITDLVTLFGAEHSLGGIQGYTDTATTDESPERVALVQQLTLAYLRTALGQDAAAWSAARSALATTPEPLGRIDTK